MKAVSLAFDDLDFVIDPLQATCMKRETAMADNAIGISFEHFRKGQQGPYPAFMSHRAPGVEEVPRTSGVSIVPEFFQVVFQKIDHHKGLINLQQCFEPRLFLVAKIFSVLQLQQYVTMYHTCVKYSDTLPSDTQMRVDRTTL